MPHQLKAVSYRTWTTIKQNTFFNQVKRLPNAFTFDMYAGKSWRIDGKTFGFFASVNNVFDVIYKTGGFEQTRNANFREVNQDVSSGTPAFAPKYFYGYGRTYFVNLYINF